MFCFLWRGFTGCGLGILVRLAFADRSVSKVLLQFLGRLCLWIFLVLLILSLGLMMLGIGVCLYVLSEIIFFTIFRTRPLPRRTTQRHSTIVSVESPLPPVKRPSMKLLKPTLESILESQELIVTKKRESWHFEPFESVLSIQETCEDTAGFDVEV